MSAGTGAGRVAPVLVTGFEPFLKHRVNSSWEAARGLDGTVLAGRPIVARRLPVSFARADPMLLRWLRELRPAAVLCLGLAEEGKLRLECVALNVDHAEKPDNDGRTRRSRSIVARGPLALPSRLPLAAMERQLARLGVPVRRSFHAGTYLCNHVFYTVLTATRVPAGFVHVPPLATASRRRGRIGLATLRRAVRALVETLAECVERKKRSR